MEKRDTKRSGGNQRFHTHSTVANTSERCPSKSPGETVDKGLATNSPLTLFPSKTTFIFTSMAPTESTALMIELERTACYNVQFKSISKLLWSEAATFFFQRAS